MYILLCNLNNDLVLAIEYFTENRYDGNMR